MKEVFYSETPSVFQTYENGEVQYRWDIEEVISQWKCKEVTINSPIDKDKLTQAVITSVWDSDLENKLINDYNGAKAGLFDEETNQKYIDAYMDFLIQRKAIKEQIDSNWSVNR